ncbi:carbohydrate sulfotransferase 11-like [Rhinophrynus dorsalis]
MLLNNILAIFSANHKEEPPKYPHLTADRFLHVQQLRKQKLRDFCLRHPELGSLQTAQGAKDLISNMAVNRKLQMLYCKTTAAGIAHWEELIKLIERNVDVTIETPVVDQDTPSATSTSIQLSDYNLLMLEEILRSYTKVLFIRDPFERLVSSYMDGFSGEVTFNEFVEDGLSLEPGKSDDDPRRTIISLCHPCFIRYDYMVTYSFLHAEIYHLLKRMGLPDGILLPQVSDTKAKRTYKWLTENLFRQLTKQEIKRLTEVYSWDLEAFALNSSLLWNHSMVTTK